MGTSPLEVTPRFLGTKEKIDFLTILRFSLIYFFYQMMVFYPIDEIFKVQKTNYLLHLNNVLAKTLISKHCLKENLLRKATSKFPGSFI